MYLAQAFWAWFVDWIVPKWQKLRQVITWAALKSKALAALKKLRTRNTGDR